MKEVKEIGRKKEESMEGRVQERSEGSEGKREKEGKKIKGRIQKRNEKEKKVEEANKGERERR